MTKLSEIVKDDETTNNFSYTFKDNDYDLLKEFFDVCIFEVKNNSESVKPIKQIIKKI